MSNNFARHLIRLVPPFLRQSIKNLPLIGPLQRSVVDKYLSGKPFEHSVDSGPAKGVRFIVQLPEDKGIWTGGYEADFATSVASKMQSMKDAVAYDIGGWHGFFSGVFGANGAREVHVFEPLPANQDRIRKLIQINPELDICLHEIALSNSDGESHLVVMPHTSMAKLEQSTFQMNRDSLEKTLVTTRRLDGLVASGSIPPPDIIKMDVEGAETAVLEGALNTLRTHKPVLFVEVHSADLMKECSKILLSLGYDWTEIDGDTDEQVVQIQAWASLG